MKRWILLAVMAIALVGMCLMFDGAYAAPNLVLGEYTPYCESCDLCIMSDDTEDLRETDISFIAENYNSKVVYNDINIEQTFEKIDNCKFDNDGKWECEKAYKMCWHWDRDRSDTVDLIPVILGIEYKEWAAWSPTAYYSHVTNNTMFLMGVNASYLWQFNNTDAAAKSLEYRILYSNRTVLQDYIRIDNRTYVEPDGDCASDSSSWGDTCFLDQAQVLDYVYNVSAWTNPDDWNTTNFPSADDIDFNQGWAGYYYDQDIWFTDDGYGAAGHGEAIFDMPDTMPDGVYYWSVRQWNAGNYSTDQGTTWYIVADNNAAAWQEASHQATITNGNMSFWVGTTAASYELDGLQFYSQNDWGNLTFNVNLKTIIGVTGDYIVQFKSYNRTMDGMNDSYEIWFELEGTDPPACEVASISSDHWWYNLTKRIIVDGDLTPSGYIKENQWENGTIWNDSWTALNTGSWVNETLSGVLPFYGNQYVKYYANDSGSTWVSCAQDSFETTTGGGLTDEQNATLYGITATATTQDVDIILGFFLFAGLCFAVAIMFQKAKGVTSFFGMMIFLFFAGMGIFVMSLGASAIYTGWNNTDTWNSTGMGIPDTMMNLSIWGVWVWVTLIVLGVLFWLMKWFAEYKGVKQK